MYLFFDYFLSEQEEIGVSISHQTAAVSNNIQLGKSFIREYEAGDIPADVPYTTLFRGRYHIPPQCEKYLILSYLVDYFQ